MQRIQTYKKALQAVLYPETGVTRTHQFVPWTVTKATLCEECEGFLMLIPWGAVRCTQCQIKCHERCKSIVNAQCVPRTSKVPYRKGSAGSPDIVTEQLDVEMHFKLH